MGTFTTFSDPIPKIVDFPPSFESAPFKPIFYDLAFGAIEFPITNIERLKKSRSRLTRFDQKVDERSGFLGSVLGGFFGNKK